MLALQLVIHLGVDPVNFMAINLNVPIIKFTSKAIWMASAPRFKLVFPPQ